MFRPWHTLDDVYRLIRKSPRGLVLIDDFMVRMAFGDIRIKYMDQKAKARLMRDSHVKGQPAAAFTYDGKEKVIYIDPAAETGILVPMLIHEIVHSTDEDYLASREQHEELMLRLRSEAGRVMGEASRRLNVPRAQLTRGDCPKEDIERLVELRQACERFDHIRTFKAEVKAYLEQYRVTLELIRKFPDYASYLKRWEKQGYIVVRPLRAEDIIEKYGLRREYVIADSKPAA
jgi:hypothetical protein